MDGKRNVYENIVAEWRSLIEVGAWQEGDKLPSVRTYAMERKVNPNTVAKAYAALEEEGYILVQPKKGAYVTGRRKDTHVEDELYKRLCEWKRAGIIRGTIEKMLNEVYKEKEE